MSVLQKLKNRRVLRNHIVPVLATLGLVSFALMGYNLGQRSTDSGFVGGQIVDTIVLDPNGGVTTNLPISLFGQVSYSDGTLCTGSRIELHSMPRSSDADEYAGFFFHNVERGKHSVSVLDQNGGVLAQADVFLSQDREVSSAELSQLESGDWSLVIGDNVALVELEMKIDKKTGKLIIDDENIAVVTNNGVITTADGKASSAGGTILSPKGAVILSNGSIVIPKRGIVTPDGSFIGLDGSVTKADGTLIAPDGTVTMTDGSVISTNGTAVFADGTTVSKDGKITGLDGKPLSPDDDGAIVLSNGITLDFLTGVVSLPDGTVIDKTKISLPDGTEITYDKKVVLSDGTTIAADNSTAALPDGTVVNLINGNTVLPDATVIHSDNVLTLPDGTKIDNRNKTIYTTGGAVISADGAVRLPDGTVIFANGTVETANGDTVKPDKSGNIKLADGTEIKNGKVYLPDGTSIGDGEVKTSGGIKVQIPRCGSGYIYGRNQARPISQKTDKPDSVLQTPAATPSPKAGTTPKTQETPKQTTPVQRPDPKTGETPKPSPSPAIKPSPSPAVSPKPSSPAAPTASVGKTPVVSDADNPNGWTQLSTINLFAENDSMVSGKIYPGVTGSYRFNISNPNGYAVKFDMNISETAHIAGQIPFKYKLKLAKTGEYLAGSADRWLTPAQLSAVLVTLPAGGKTGYVLEWRWPYNDGSDELDTAIGSSTQRNHYVSIIIHAEQVTG